jgi:hypothetical protein
MVRGRLVEHGDLVPANPPGKALIRPFTETIVLVVDGLIDAVLDRSKPPNALSHRKLRTILSFKFAWGHFSRVEE